MKNTATADADDLGAKLDRIIELLEKQQTTTNNYYYHQPTTVPFPTYRGPYWWGTGSVQGTTGGTIVNYVAREG